MTTSCSLVPQNNTIDGNVETPAIDLGEFLTDPDTGEKLQAQLVLHRTGGEGDHRRDRTSPIGCLDPSIGRRPGAPTERTAELVEERTAAIAREDSKNNGLPLSISTLSPADIPICSAVLQRI
ncbi:hypothetical protein ACETU7_22720 [Rhodococcus sp. 3Y1]